MESIIIQIIRGHVTMICTSLDNRVDHLTVVCCALPKANYWTSKITFILMLLELRTLKFLSQTQTIHLNTGLLKLASGLCNFNRLPIMIILKSLCLTCKRWSTTENFVIKTLSLVIGQYPFGLSFETRGITD